MKYPITRLGIIGGGQLARMTALAAIPMGVHVSVLEKGPNAPACGIADRHIDGSLYDPQKLRQLVESCEVTTYDIEHTDTQTLIALAREGHRILPSPTLLATIQDKYVQKKHLADHGLPVPRFDNCQAPTPDTLRAFGLPLVQKAREGGYDGRGVQLIRTEADLGQLIPAPSLLEACVDIETELAVLVARDLSGDVRCYPVVEMVFDDANNILDMLIAPARISAALAAEAEALAVAAVRALDGVGIFAVELFLDKQGQLLVNEIAPRPHNSGHFTIEACPTSQYAQHVRAVCGLPLGSTRQSHPAVMLNLLGAPGFSGSPRINGLRKTLALENVFVHLYGKAETRPARKMGHVTILGETLEEALAKSEKVQQWLTITAEEV
ncbi:MAG TPA: 5-(carboxyamino)imidazole ribonucleotide synthase [Calditrichia bacterium]|nr:5-(carboxyamino)imidazole ribonucleotide synthase [Calditrichota bacterium]HQV30427.1 5-(carboxyamino)imidazole ribonucleotide synthase [Calditrichia bacterium]